MGVQAGEKVGRRTVEGRQATAPQMARAGRRHSAPGEGGRLVETSVVPLTVGGNALVSRKQLLLSVTPKQRHQYEQKFEAWVQTATPISFLRGIGRPQLQFGRQQKVAKSLVMSPIHKPTIYEQAKARCLQREAAAAGGGRRRRAGYHYAMDGQARGPCTKGGSFMRRAFPETTD